MVVLLPAGLGDGLRLLGKVVVVVVGVVVVLVLVLVLVVAVRMLSITAIVGTRPPINHPTLGTSILVHSTLLVSPISLTLIEPTLPAKGSTRATRTEMVSSLTRSGCSDDWVPHYKGFDPCGICLISGNRIGRLRQQ